ncbi:MAG: type II secretion system protein [Actinomycetota bacterium]|nr:type II secretion system protein [Actinomycetota bacterium]
MAALFNKFKCALKKGKVQDGFTLVEVIVALFIISIITGVVIHSSIMAIDTSQINRAKTVALNIVNEEIEKIRAMDYQDIGLIGSDPEGILEAQVNTEDGYRVNYNIVMG